MKKIESLSAVEVAQVQFVLTDIDDTLTHDGKLLACAYNALWQLHAAGYRVIPVTGRPAGWCDLIIRQWPVEAVIGENGAFVYYLQQNVRQSFTHPLADNRGSTEVFTRITQQVLREVPGCRVASDQFSRIYDLAIDFKEEPEGLGLAEAEKIRRICNACGAEAKISSIHVNAWLGKYDKLSMARLYLQKFHGLTEEQLPAKVLYCGDSPNDEPMFAFFPLSVGVANIEPFLPLLTSQPGYITTQGWGYGFEEAVGRLLALRPQR